MNVFETARILGYGVMVPVLFFTGFLVYRRNAVLAAFFLLQGSVYLVQLSMLVFAPNGTPYLRGSNLEPIYSLTIAAQAIVSVLLIRREFMVRRKLRTILYEPDFIYQEVHTMPKFQIPGVLPVALILLLPPAIIPVIQQFFPTNTYWWSALLVVVLNVIVLVVRISWPEESGKVPMPMSQEAPEGTVTPEKGRSTFNKILLGA